MSVTIDGWASAAWIHHRDVKVAFLFTVVDGLITDIDLVADPHSLGAMAISGTSNPNRGSNSVPGGSNSDPGGVTPSRGE